MADILVHPRWLYEADGGNQLGKSGNDVALLTLETEVEVNHRNVDIAVLPDTRRHTHLTEPGTKTEVAGFGRTVGYKR